MATINLGGVMISVNRVHPYILTQYGWNPPRITKNVTRWGKRTYATFLHSFPPIWVECKQRMQGCKDVMVWRKIPHEWGEKMVRFLKELAWQFKCWQRGICWMCGTKMERNLNGYALYCLNCDCEKNNLGW